MNGIREKNDFKRRLGQIITEFERRTKVHVVPEYTGAQPTSPLEHTTRRHLIDHMLEALGWRLDSMNEGVIEEARVKGNTTFFLDYLGVTLTTRVPLAIMEAKAWAKPFVAASSVAIASLGQRNTTSAAALLAAAIQHCKSGGGLKDSPVTVEWAEWLSTLRDYVVNLRDRSSHVPTRVAISSGRWLVIFTDIEAVFISAAGDVPSASIRVFVGKDMVVRSDEIFDLLARSTVVDDVPTFVQPSRLPAFTSQSDILRVFRAVWVTRSVQGAYFQPHPQLGLNVALVIERRDGTLLTVLDNQLPHAAVPHDYNGLTYHIEEVARLADRLLQSTSAELGVQLVLSPIQDFAGFPGGLEKRTSLPRGADDRAILIKPYHRKADEFLLVLGRDTHFLRSRPEVNSCGFHEWAVCRAQHQSQGSSPIVSRSVTPAAFFYSGESHHCAHRTVHGRRNGKCQIIAFEEFLCCRACVLQSFCWDHTNLSRLPCGSVPANEAIPIASEKSVIQLRQQA